MKSFVKVHLFPLRYAEQWKQRPKVDGVVAGGWGDGGAAFGGDRVSVLRGEESPGDGCSTG